jgi:hypothetical protein
LRFDVSCYWSRKKIGTIVDKVVSGGICAGSSEDNLIVERYSQLARESKQWQGCFSDRRWC